MAPVKYKKKFHPSTICRTYPSTICRSYGACGAGWVKMMGELVPNEVEGKVVFTIKMVYFHPCPQYSSIPFFHSDGINILH